MGTMKNRSSHSPTPGKFHNNMDIYKANYRHRINKAKGGASVRIASAVQSIK